MKFLKYQDRVTTIFSKIIKGDIPCYKIAEDDNFLAILDVRPIAKGHTLCIPKIEVDYIFDLDDDLLQRLMLFSKKVAKGIQKVVPCPRIGVAVEGFEVPHAHIHLFPIFPGKGVSISRPRMTLPEAEMAKLAEEIGREVKLF